MAKNLRDKFRGCLVGLAVGDALGATNEFKSRSDCGKNPVTGMIGGGAWGLRPGDWTDDTSMAFGLAESLARLGRFDPLDVMGNWSMWYHGRAFGGSHGRGCFDVGGTTRKAIVDYDRTGDPWQGQSGDWSAANGCLMRFAPVALYAYPLPPAERRKLARDVCNLTHGHKLCLAASELFGDLLHWILAGVKTERVVYRDAPRELVERLERRAWEDAEPTRISSSGFVLDTLEAAMWAVQSRPGDGFRECVLRAVNLGYDADTVGAVAGQFAGAEYGYSGIPAEWIAVLDRRDELVALADELFDLSQARLAVRDAKPTEIIPQSAIARHVPDDEPLPGHAPELGDPIA